MKEYYTSAYPEKVDWLDNLLNDEEKPNNYLTNNQLKVLLGELYEPVMELRLNQMRSRLQARLPFSISVK